MLLSDAVYDYEVRGRYRGGKGWNAAHSPATFAGYRNRLQQLQRWFQETGKGDPDISEITHDLLEDYFYFIVSQGVRPRTQRQHVHAWRFLFRYLVWRKVLAEDPTERIKLPQLDDAQRTLLGEDDLVKLYEASLRQANDFKAIRDRAVISVLIFTAIRRGGLLGLKVGDVDLKEGRLLVLEKGRKYRGVPLCDEPKADLELWLEVRRRLATNHDRLFCVDQRRPLGETGLAMLVRDVAAIAGLKEGNAVKPHTLRHACATRFLNNGASLKDCQVLLGHSDLKTTALYLHADEESIRPLSALLSIRRQPAQPEVRDEEQRKERDYHRRRRVSR